MKKILLVLSLGCSVVLFNGCGGGTPAPVATHLSVTTSSAAITVGTAFSITVSALDNSGAVVTTYSGTVHFASSDAQAVLPNDSPLTNGTKVFQVTFNSPGSQSITVSDSTGALTAGTSSPVTVSGTTATQFSVTATAVSQTAGTAFNITVKATDSANNVIASYTGTVHFTSSDAQAVLPANSTLTNGTGSFSVTLKTAGAQSITATDTAASSVTGTSSAITINPGPVASFSIAAPPAATTGISFSATVNAVDTYANVATSYSGTVHFSSSDAQAVLPANSALASGTGNFPISLKTLGSQTISATDAAAASLTGKSSSINVVTNVATHLSVVSSNTGPVTRQTFSVTVTALDAANNTSVGYSGTVHFTSTDTQAMLPGNSTLSSGTASFSVTLETAGNQTVTAADTATASITGNSGTLSVTQAAALSVISSSPPNGTVGVYYDRRVIRVCIVWSGLTCQRFGFATIFGFPLNGSGGVTPYKWSWAGATGSSVPQGLNVLSAGNTNCKQYNFRGIPFYPVCIGGIPTQPGTFNVLVTVTDSGVPAVQASAPFTIQIAPPAPPVVSTTPGPPVGAINKPYSFTFSATGYAPLTWSEQGTLPTGLTFDSNTQVLSGTPTQMGTFPITITATDQFNQSSAPNFNIVIALHGFQATNGMLGARVFHTATYLNTGKVLVAGGTDANGNTLATAELYDPSTGSFSSAGNMGTGRHHFAATLLSSGKVLITGGMDSSGNPLSSAEIYDPVAGTFSPTKGPMIAVHASHTATLLNTGKVLVAGWGNAVAELFDPSTGTFTQTGSMVQPRVDHTATLLNNGKVLITGGIQGTSPSTTVLAEAELYDPSTGSFLPTIGTMNSTRHLHTASLLSDGTVLVAGGLDNTGAALSTAEVFDPNTQSFAVTKGAMGSARYVHTATLLTDKTVLLVGGNDGTNALATAEVYDPAAGTFSPTGSLGTARQSHTATILGNGTVVVAGGANSGAAALTSVELYQ